MVIIDTLRFRWVTASMLLRLIIVNIGVFILLTALSLICALANSSFAIQLLRWIQVPPTFQSLLVSPWTLITYMFVQTDFWHVLVNMLWLYWFGSVFMTVGNNRRLLFLYVSGGLVGALCFVATTLFPWIVNAGVALTGSSSAVMAVIAATTLLSPDFRMRLPIFGQVRLKWIGVISIGLCLLQGTPGVFAAHIGGVIAGVTYIAIARHRGRVKYIDPIDNIITKAKKSGFASLSDEEKRYLFKTRSKGC